MAETAATHARAQTMSEVLRVPAGAGPPATDARAPSAYLRHKCLALHPHACIDCREPAAAAHPRERAFTHTWPLPVACGDFKAVLAQRTGERPHAPAGLAVAGGAAPAAPCSAPSRALSLGRSPRGAEPRRGARSRRPSGQGPGGWHAALEDAWSAGAHGRGASRAWQSLAIDVSPGQGAGIPPRLSTHSTPRGTCLRLQGVQGVRDLRHAALAQWQEVRHLHQPVGVHGHLVESGA